jgi:nucleoside phosphorylase
MASVVLGSAKSNTARKAGAAMEKNAAELGIVCHAFENPWNVLEAILHKPGATLADFWDPKKVKKEYANHGIKIDVEFNASLD